MPQVFVVHSSTPIAKELLYGEGVPSIFRPVSNFGSSLALGHEVSREVGDFDQDAHRQCVDVPV
jgi:hypothetical protein